MNVDYRVRCASGGSFTQVEREIRRKNGEKKRNKNRMREQDREKEKRRTVFLSTKRRGVKRYKPTADK